jgi:hypothetical protein
MRCQCGREIPEQTIVSEAARLLAARRKTRGGPKPKAVKCSWCGAECAGQRGLVQHLPACQEAIAYHAGLAVSDVAEFFNEAGG